MKIQRMRVTAVGLALALGTASPGLSQEAARSGFEWGGLPAINFDSDEGFGYGVITELYHYGDAGFTPYVWTLQPTVFLTTEGRRDLYAFFDAPHLLPRGWRLTAFVGTEKQIATPYYGIGNESVHERTLEAEGGPNPFFYRFGRTRNSATFALQRDLRADLRILLGGGLKRTEIVSVPEGNGTTLYAAEFGAAGSTSWTNFVRGGVVWDTRDRETGPRSGTWTEMMVQWADESLGSDFAMTRWTLTDRRYFALTDRLVFAHRWSLQQVSDGVPVHELFALQTSFKEQEGLGGSKTIRGVRKNRYVGRGMLVWNSELRWEAAEFDFLGRSFRTILSGFLDQGRVWSGQVQADELFSGLHRGFGGGIRVGMGDNFIVAVDVGTSSDTAAPIYIGLGYLY